jgi:hypothetical protein
MSESLELIDEVVAALEDCSAVLEDFVGEEGFEERVWQHLWAWVQRRCQPGGPGADKTPGSILLTSHAKRKERKERDEKEWERFQAPPDKLADAVLLDGCFSRLDIVLRSPAPQITIGIEVERIKTPPPGRKKPKADPLIHGLGQAALALLRREWTVLVVYWPVVGVSTREERRQLRDALEGWFRDRRLRVVILPSA